MHALTAFWQSGVRPGACQDTLVASEKGDLRPFCCASKALRMHQLVGCPAALPLCICHHLHPAAFGGPTPHTYMQTQACFRPAAHSQAGPRPSTARPTATPSANLIPGSVSKDPLPPLCSGNVATEDVVYMLSGFGIQHGVDLERLVDASAFITQVLGRRPNSRVAEAMLRKREAAAVKAAQAAQAAASSAGAAAAGAAAQSA